MMNRRGILLFQLQYLLGRTAVWLTAPLIMLLIKLMGYRVRNLRQIRSGIGQLFEDHPGPWILCANHLTLIDSVIIAYALFPFYRYMINFRLLSWNMPEKTNFQQNLVTTVLCYLLKCVPVVRGGSRESVRHCLARCDRVLEKGESILIFPEGTRSRSGRIDPERFSYGPGRLLAGHPDCRVLCLYLRGDRQKNFGRIPVFGERFYLAVRSFQPEPEGKGLRRQRYICRQIIDTLIDMETFYFGLCGQ